MPLFYSKPPILSRDSCVISCCLESSRNLPELFNFQNTFYALQYKCPKGKAPQDKIKKEGDSIDGLRACMKRRRAWPLLSQRGWLFCKASWHATALSAFNRFIPQLLLPQRQKRRAARRCVSCAQNRKEILHEEVFYEAPGCTGAGHCFCLLDVRRGFCSR